MTGDSSTSATTAHDDTFTAAGAALTLDRACRVAGLSGEGARLMRLGSNAVFRLSGDVVARISRASTDVAQARRAVAVARWLQSADYPAVRALPIDQPVTVDGSAVTFWEAISDDGDEYASVREVAEAISKLHRLQPPKGLELPKLAPFEQASQRIEATPVLSPDDRQFLMRRLSELQEGYAELRFSLPEGVIHGDANVGNVIRNRSGVATVIDLDGFSVGPREWDLILTAIYYDRFGWHTKEEYDLFARTYGFDVMKWPGYVIMRDVREFLMVTWVCQKAGESEVLAEEAKKRVSALRTGGSRMDWQPF